MPPREPGYSNHYYWDYLFIGVLLLAVCIGIFGGCSRSIAGEKEKAEADATLALAKAKRDRQSAKPAVDKLTANQDYEKAVLHADLTGKPLVLWVGIKCSDHDELYRNLSGAVHCQLPRWRKDDTPRLVIMGGDDCEYWIAASKLNLKSADKIREKWSLPYIPPVRGGIRISEEISINYNGGICLPGST